MYGYSKGRSLLEMDDLNGRIINTDLRMIYEDGFITVDIKQWK